MDHQDFLLLFTFDYWPVFMEEVNQDPCFFAHYFLRFKVGKKSGSLKLFKGSAVSLPTLERYTSYW